MQHAYLMKCAPHTLMSQVHCYTAQGSHEIVYLSETLMRTLIWSRQLTLQVSHTHLIRLCSTTRCMLNPGSKVKLDPSTTTCLQGPVLQQGAAKRHDAACLQGSDAMPMTTCVFPLTALSCLHPATPQC
jgi:hypothetical protein